MQVKIKDVFHQTAKVGQVFHLDIGFPESFCS